MTCQRKSPLAYFPSDLQLNSVLIFQLSVTNFSRQLQGCRAERDPSSANAKQVQIRIFMAEIQRPPASVSLVLFARGVIARLEIWSILRVAVQEGWGGPKSADKRTWLASEIVDAFQQQASVPDDQYVEELLLQVMEDEFDCIVEDGSGEAVGKDIVQVWEESQSEKQDAILKFEESARNLKGKKVDAKISSEENEVDGDEDAGDDDKWEDESEDEEMWVDEAPQLIDHRNQNEPQVDENGFILVKRKGKGRR